MVGVGSALSRDDGVGLVLVDRLRERRVDVQARCWSDADAATVVSNLLELDAPVLFVDCAQMSLPPGEFRCFDEQRAALRIRRDSVSTHGLGLAEGLAIARQLGFVRSVSIFAVQPYSLVPGLGLSPSMEARLDGLTDALSDSFDQLRVEVSERAATLP